MVPLYRVVWELSDDTQDAIEDLLLEEAVEKLAEKTKEFGHSFNWLQIERI